MLSVSSVRQLWWLFVILVLLLLLLILLFCCIIYAQRNRGDSYSGMLPEKFSTILNLSLNSYQCVLSEESCISKSCRL